MEYVDMDNIARGACMILNILWDRNREMTARELTCAAAAESGRDWTREDIKGFADYLVEKDYVQRRWRGVRLYYAALGECGEPEE